MISKNLYFNLLARVLFMVLFAVLSGYLIGSGRSLRIFIICFLVLVIITISLISFLNSTNRRIRYFFDSVRNDDSNLSFPVDEKNETVREIYQSMNNVNQQIQDLKIEIRNQEMYFQTLIEHLAIGILTFDRKGFVLHCNTSAKMLLGTEVLTHLKQLERIDGNLFHTIKNINPNERKLIALITERGEKQLALKSALFRTKKDELVIMSVQDIKHELDEKEVESWMKLIRVLMHEIMNSITPITSISESLSGIYTVEGKTVSPGSVTPGMISTTLDGLNVIREQGKGLMSFVDSYRKLTRIPDPDKQFFRVSDLFERLKMIAGSHEKYNKTDLVFSIEHPDMEVFADQNLIIQVLINLIKNAFEAVGNTPGARISVTAGTNRDLNPQICVADNGPGIPAENLKEIFVPFFTTREKGSGIGLSVSKQIMRIHGGNLEVRSMPGVETVFCLRL